MSKIGAENLKGVCKTTEDSDRLASVFPDYCILFWCGLCHD